MIALHAAPHYDGSLHAVPDWLLISPHGDAGYGQVVEFITPGSATGVVKAITAIYEARLRTAWHPDFTPDAKGAGVTTNPETFGGYNYWRLNATTKYIDFQIPMSITGDIDKFPIWCVDNVSLGGVGKVIKNPAGAATALGTFVTNTNTAANIRHDVTLSETVTGGDVVRFMANDGETKDVRFHSFLGFISGSTPGEDDDLWYDEATAKQANHAASSLVAAAMAPPALTANDAFLFGGLHQGTGTSGQEANTGHTLTLDDGSATDMTTLDAGHYTADDSIAIVRTSECRYNGTYTDIGDLVTRYTITDLGLVIRLEMTPNDANPHGSLYMVMATGNEDTVTKLVRYDTLEEISAPSGTDLTLDLPFTTWSCVYDFDSLTGRGIEYNFRDFSHDPEIALIQRSSGKTKVYPNNKVEGALTADVTYAGEVLIRFGAVDAPMYRVYRRDTASGSDTLITQVPSDQLQATVDALPADSTSYYLVRAVSACGVEDAMPVSNRLRRVALDDSADLIDPAPNPPYNLRLVQGPAGLVTARWAYRADGAEAAATKFNVYIATGETAISYTTPDFTVSTVAQDNTQALGTFADTTAVKCVVRAVAAGDVEETNTNEATGTADAAAPAVPTSITVTAEAD